MRSAFQSSRPAAPIKAAFINDEVVCPLCESYNIEEGKYRFECHTCGTVWKTLNLGK